MHRIYWILVLVAALATAAIGQTEDTKTKPKAKVSGNAATEQKLVETEKSLWEAWKNHDSGIFQKALTPESVNVTAMGIQGTEQTVKDAGSSDCKVNSYSLEDTKSTWVDKDAVLLTYKASQDAVCASQKLPSAVWASSLWVKKGSEWKAAFHQETPVQNSMGAEEKKTGIKGSSTRPLIFADAVIPRENLLGEPGRGFQEFLAVLDGGRIAIAALALGLSRACLEACVAYANERRAFGGPIARFQGVSFPIADLAVAVESARLLTYHAAWLKDRGRPFRHAAAIAKLHATEAAVDAGRTATQVFGGSGFLEETAANRYYRDAKVLEVGEGTSEIQRLVIARQLLKD